MRNVGIVIFDKVEVLDFCGPFEVFSTASLPTEPNTYPEPSLFRAWTVAATREPVRAVGGLEIIPACSIDDHPTFDLIVVPGGYGTRTIAPELVRWIAAQSPALEITTSVCTGAFLLAEAGLLAGQRATTHWGSIDSMRSTYPDITVIDDERVIDNGRIVTSAGVSAGIDMALHIVERLHGLDAARKTARDMEYRWERTA
jgi:transcriptional regulator GlxA family with amidase domain